MEFGYTIGKKLGKLGLPKHTYTKQVHESGTCAQTSICDHFLVPDVTNTNH